MPTYVLRCQQCGKTFELQSSISEYEQSRSRGAYRCPSCSSANLEPQLAAATVVTSKKS